jgi:pimeloyl-ACP methyl ester carboxylesterase
MRKDVFAAAMLAAALLTSPVIAQDQIDVLIPSGDHVLAGTLTVPAGDGPFPGVVLISGSGPSDRDESLPGVALKPFARLAQELAAEGVATLRYDDRGVGKSTGDFLSATSFDFADDARAVLDFLAAGDKIDSGRVGFLGHSEGGMIAPHAAVDNDQVAFVVSLAGTAVTGYEVFATQLRQALASLPQADREAAFAQQIHSLDLVVAEDWPAVEAMLASEEGATPERVAQGMVYYRGWLHTFVTHDPAVDWQQIDQPVFALFGGRDVQVSADLNRPALEAALQHNPDVSVVTLPTANHLFQDAETGAPPEYTTLPDAFVGELSARIAEWIKTR